MEKSKHIVMVNDKIADGVYGTRGDAWLFVRDEIVTMFFGDDYENECDCEDGGELCQAHSLDAHIRAFLVDGYPDQVFVSESRINEPLAVAVVPVRHYHVSGLGDGIQELFCLDLTDACQLASDGAGQHADYLEECATASAEHGDKAEAWDIHVKAVDLQTLSHNLDVLTRRQAPLFAPTPGLTGLEKERDAAYGEALLEASLRHALETAGTECRVFISTCDQKECWDSRDE